MVLDGCQTHYNAKMGQKIIKNDKHVEKGCSLTRSAPHQGVLQECVCVGGGRAYRLSTGFGDSCPQLLAGGVFTSHSDWVQPIKILQKINSELVLESV